MGLFGRKHAPPPPPAKTEAQLRVEEMARRLAETTAKNGKIMEQVQEQVQEQLGPLKGSTA